MKKLSVVLYVVAALVLLLSGASGASGAMAGPSQKEPASTSATVAAAAGTSVLSIPAAAFTPFEDGYDFENHGRYLKHFGGPAARGWYLAPVQLPHGAVVTKVTFYSYDDSTSANGYAKLQRTDLAGSFIDMASLDSLYTGGYVARSTTTISSPAIDNSKYTYWVVWDLSNSTGTGNDVWGCGMVIEYTPPATVTGRLAIPAAAFTPYEDGYDYENHGRYLFPKVGASGPYGWFLAHVRLPHGATVTKMTFYWYDNEAFFLGKARLQRTKFGQGNFEEMAYAETVSGGYGSTPDNTISYASIDNSQYAYWVIWDLPVSGAGAFRGCGVVIDYTVPATGDGPLSISSAPFKPYEDGYDFQNDSRYLKHFHSPGGWLENGWYLAQVHLPQGATVTKMTYHYYNTKSGGSGGGAHLQRTRLGQGNYEDMAGIGVGGPGGGYSSYSDDTIDYAAIDNSQYAYWVLLDLPVSLGGADQQIWGCGVVIEYSFRVYLPLVLRQ